MYDFSPQLEHAIDYSFDQLNRHNNDVSSLPIELQTVVRVVSTQGVLGNGGVVYFFESNCSGLPPYQVFVDAYRIIGAERIAGGLESAVALFKFENPHLDANRRLQRISELIDEEKAKTPQKEPQQDEEADEEDFASWDNLQSAWQLLDQYVRKHAVAFARDE